MWKQLFLVTIYPPIPLLTVRREENEDEKKEETKTVFIDRTNRSMYFSDVRVRIRTFITKSRY